MKKHLLFFVFAILLLGVNHSLLALPAGDIQVHMTAETGSYTVSSSSLHWTFGGTIGQPVHKLATAEGIDSIGKYTSLSFQWTTNNLYMGRIRWYASLPVVLFSITTPNGSADQPMEPFPDFSKMPDSLHYFSYHNRIFPLPQFILEETSTPWMFFNDRKDACILSPASDFMVSLMTGDGSTHVRSGLNPQLKKLPADFTHTTIMVLRNGIRNAWDQWGDALRAMYKRKRPVNDADVLLKYFGYWTDNGGDYYYNYDSTKGYAGTLLAVREHYKKQHIPMGYMQLDSWWYQKSYNNVYNIPGSIKKKQYPEGPWNRSGGLMEYKADTYLFPNGLSHFQQQLGVPLVTHNRWMDSSSPYHKKYKISGLSATDPAFWQEIMSYLKASGVTAYEQDWINYIYTNNPEMAADITVGNAFTDGMAKAALDNGINLQYCMGLPRYFMQGVKYNNLTTIRTAGDRFKPERWRPFIFTSQLAYEMGIWPWSDVFKSSEMGNLIVSVLSAGAVGTGDSIGKEVKANILMACRQDGVIVKPDLPLLPLDQNYVEMARSQHTPVAAYTYTRHRDIQTSYVFVFADDTVKQSQYTVSLADIGLKGRAVAYNSLAQTAQVLEAGSSIQAGLPKEGFDFYIVAPVTSAGIAFLGDEGKITATGKKRIPDMVATGNKLQVKVLFGDDDPPVTLHGYSEKANIKADSGKLQYDAATHLFSLLLQPPVKGKTVTITLETK